MGTTLRSMEDVMAGKNNNSIVLIAQVRLFPFGIPVSIYLPSFTSFLFVLCLPFSDRLSLLLFSLSHPVSSDLRLTSQILITLAVSYIVNMRMKHEVHSVSHSAVHMSISPTPVL